jgi:uncharacterized protein
MPLRSKIMNRTFPYPLIGMVHLLPLPGSPGYGGSRAAIRASAVRDALTLQRCGFDALLVENFGDAPFRKNRVGPSVVSEMTAVLCEIHGAVSIPTGVQVLRNDAAAAMSIAAAVGLEFIRVNVHTGVMFTDQGMIEGNADETLRLKTSLGCKARILADVFVKHAHPLPGSEIADAARDACQRGLADALIVTGRATGAAPPLEDVDKVAAAVNIPVLAGSGVNASTVKSVLARADGVIVGTSVKRGGITTNPVDPRRAAAFVKAAGR